MTSGYKSYRATRFLGGISQYILAALFLFSGFVKAVDPVGTALKVSDYLTAFGLSALRGLSLSCAVGLIVVEFSLGVLLLMGLFRRFTRWAVLVLMSAMTLLTFYIFLFEPVGDCGCFGDFLKISNRATFLKNLCFMVPTLFLFIKKRAWHPSFGSRSIQFSLLALGLFGIGFFIQQNLRHLPLFDFRPFRVGSSLAELVLRPEGAAEDLYSYQFIYEKEGKKAIFEADSLPDSTWQYVDTQMTLLAEGYHPPVEDFVLFRDYEDVTRELIGNQNYNMIWVLAPHWGKASKKTIEAINQLYKYASDNGILFYGISGSDEQEIALWKEKSAAKYPMLLLDASTIQTISRANPSILFLKKGVIQAKMNALDLREGGIEAQVNALFESEKPLSQNALLRLLPLSLWFILTLVGLIVARERLQTPYTF